MQGPSSSVSTLPENIGFDHGSGSGDATIESHSQLPWTSMQATVQNRLPDYRMLPSEANNQYLQHVRHEGPNVEWSVGETSSSSSQRLGDQNERKMENSWTFGLRTNLALEERQYEDSDVRSLDNINVNSQGSQGAHTGFGLRTSSSSALPQDLNMISGFVDSDDDDDNDDDCQVVERPGSYISIGLSNEQMQAPRTSSDPFSMPPRRGGYVMDEREDRPGLSIDGRHMSCKRKALEVQTGQSSGVGSSSFQHDERNQLHTMPTTHVAVSNSSVPASTHNDAIVNNGSEPANPRLRLGAAAAARSAMPFSLTSSGNAESSRRNFRLRMNGLHQQDTFPNNSLLTETDVGNVGLSSSRHSSRLLRNHLFDMAPSNSVENANLNSRPVLSDPLVRRNNHPRWQSRTSRWAAAIAAASAASEDRRMPFGEPSSRHIPQNISEHPMFVPASEMGNSSQNPTNWNFSGGSNSVAGNSASSSRAGSSTGLNAAATSWSHRSHPQYPQRLSEIVRRSLLSSAGAEAAGQSSNHAARSGLPQEMVLPSGSESHGHRGLSSRSAYLERHVDGAFGVPHSLRALAAAGEGRGGVMSEQIRHVLDLMRRGEGLRFEDVMILDHSVLFGMADTHDRHRDMRLDVDNMSYEELLALEERIGNVCTGLSEETVTSRLKRRKYLGGKAKNAAEMEPCSICREEYNKGEDLGALECGHNFHADCIKEWLMHKNLCPICKTTGLTT
ncbi:probable E3 ubiquitin-protein ligase RHG1A isoform X1 [Salvia hispanica]|uniref:probable E3 ubiquitin-protein ligase RHG1A isoform X1 n=1 Tax=Salvia hispanica TaxID=49212 RepID=UPI0020095BD2|nr:probable E3 ubiquitin-protein ligase RHG1A isoform X1 [Salvia hispanica]